MRRLLNYLWPYKWLAALSLFSLAVIAVMEMAGPYIIKLAIDNELSANDYQGLLILAIIYIVVLIFNAFGEYAHILLTRILGQKIMYDIRTQVFTHIQRLPLSFFDKNPVGRLVTRVTNDVETLNDMLSSGVVAILGDIIVLAGIVFVMLSLNWQLAIVSLVVLPFMALATSFYRSRIRDVYRTSRLRLAKINSYLQENISGMATVQIFNRETENYARFEKLSDSYREINLKGIRYHSIFYPIISLLSTLSTALIIWYGGNRIFNNFLSLGVLVAFMQYIRRFFMPLNDLADKYNMMQAAMASSERVFKLLDEKEQKLYHGTRVPLAQTKGKIEFRDLSFAYNSEDYVLKNVSFTIQPGEKVAIVGATGAGKTSIISLINRMYEPTHGQILLDDVDISRIALTDLRSRIGVVLQDVFIFSGSVEQNITLGNPSISQDEIKAAARRVNVDRFISKMTGQYNHELTERGSNLSVGQKQLLSFARALAYNPEILILDEATSSVDTETEQLISDAIHTLIKNRTSIIIAHRLSTIRDVDWIIVLHKGEIRETGTHEALLGKKGIYYRLYQLQFGAKAA
ncbi:ABC transporter ATP-binding protein [candidate division KSB1 bacterium]|nr:ABC transporter ATP-binding protein [candidate division KSB1 bacterium]RQW04426.1 MAG: ABC transporter ATP-binding protein [candidate division KSB1 bacterium]